MNTESKRAKYLLKNTAIFAVGNLATKLISFFLVPLYTNVLSTDQYGIADLVTTIAMVLAPILILNISESIMRFALDKDADCNKIMSIGLLILVISMIGSVSIIPVLKLISNISQYAVQVYFYTITLSASQIFLCYLRGKEKLISFSLGNILQTFSIGFFNIIFLLILKSGLSGYFNAYIIANTITCVYAFFAGNVFDVIKHINFDKKLFYAMIKYSVVLIPNTFMWWIMNSSDRIMVTAMIGAAANGIYAISYKVPSLVQVITNIFNQAWSYSAIKENSSEDKDEYTNMVYNYYVCIVTIVGISLMFIMKPMLYFYVEKSYFEAWRYTPYLVVGFVFLTLGSFLSTSYTVNKDSKGFLFSGTFGAIINVSLNFMLIPRIGIAGAALATCVSYMCVFIYRIFDTRKYVNIKIFNLKHSLGFLILLLSAASMYIPTYIGELILLFELIASFIVFRKDFKVVFGRLKKKVGYN